MTGVLNALVDLNIECCGPQFGSKPVDDDNNDITGKRSLGFTPFEEFRHRDPQIQIKDPEPDATSLFKYFLDGSMRTIRGGHILTSQARWRPLFIAQVGVAVTELDGVRFGELSVAHFESKSLLICPDEFDARDMVQRASKRLGEISDSVRDCCELSNEDKGRIDILERDLSESRSRRGRPPCGSIPSSDISTYQRIFRALVDSLPTPEIALKTIEAVLESAEDWDGSLGTNEKQRQ